MSTLQSSSFDLNNHFENRGSCSHTERNGELCRREMQKLIGQVHKMQEWYHISQDCPNKSIMFLGFPQDEQRRQIWQMAVSREAEWAATDSSAVCSDHFEPKAFFLTESGLRRLSAVAVPTINISPCESPQPTITEVKAADITPTDSQEVVQLKHKLQRLEEVAESRMKRINSMWLAHRQMERKLNKMKAIIKHLIQNKENTT